MYCVPYFLNFRFFNWVKAQACHDELGILESTVKTSTIKTDDDRIIDAFEEINVFYDKNGREPSTSSMSEFTLSAKLKNFRQDNANKLLL